MVNGVLFPGGFVDFATDDGEWVEWTKVNKVIFDHIIKMNDQGIHYPALGVC